MTEPTYTYIKGKGWMPFSERLHTLNLRDGTVVAFIARKPNIGEHYSWVSQGDSQYTNPDNTPKIEEFIKSYQGITCVNSFGKFDPSCHTDTDVFVTIVRVNDPM